MSSIFLSNVTVIDHAYIDVHGNVIGGSFNPSFVVSGATDNEEQVVADFSSVKKRIKAIIDDDKNGLDHKLWIMQNSGIASISHFKVEGASKALIQTNCGNTITVPSDALHFVNDTPDWPYTLPTTSTGQKTSWSSVYDYTCAGIGNYIENKLNNVFEPEGIHIKCLNSIDVITVPHNGNDPICYRSEPALFRYVHGLAYSSSWGCQNIAHGHLSYLFLESETEYSDGQLNELANKISNHLNNTIIVNRKHMMAVNSHLSQLDRFSAIESGNIAYTSNSRGAQSWFVAVNDKQKLFLIDKEPTIENIASIVVEIFSEELKELGVKNFYISEGLSKGAVVSI